MHHCTTDDDIYIPMAIKPSLLQSSETASANGRWTYLQHRPLLKEDSADQESNDEGRMLLSQAAENGHEAVVKLLLANDRVDVNAEDSLYRQASLQWVANNWEEPTYFEWLIRLYIFLVQIDLSLDRLSKFLNKLHPLCTTMPWNIRSALVVLWGVCWMFYSPPTALQLDEFNANWESELSNINSGNSFYGNSLNNHFAFKT